MLKWRWPILAHDLSAVAWQPTHLVWPMGEAAHACIASVPRRVVIVLGAGPVA
jgi:threonine dehydrogenase-like Zn-dependent dehydrogenase